MNAHTSPVSKGATFLLVLLGAGCFPGPGHYRPAAYRYGPARRRQVQPAPAASSRPTVGLGGVAEQKLKTAEGPLLAAEGQAAVASSQRSPAAGRKLRRLIVYRGWLQVQVTELRESAQKLKALAEQLGGYVELLTDTHVVARVPAPRFFDYLEAVGKVGEVFSKKIKAQDVTTQFMDLKLRLEAKLAVLQQLKELLKKAKDVKEALEVQKEIAKLVEEIEAMKGQLRYLSQLVAFSTVDIQLRRPEQRHRIISPPPMRSPFKWIRRLGISPLTKYLEK